MDLADLHPVTDRLAPVAATEVDAAERALDTALPAGYADFVQRYGEGLAGDFVRVYGPAGVVRMTEEWRERVREYWAWEAAGTGIAPEVFRSDGVVVADTLDGDEVCFLAGAPERCFVLPRHTDDVVPVDGGFVAALAWLLESGELVTPAPLPTFEPWVDRVRLHYDAEGEDAYPGVCAGLLALGLHDRVQEGDLRLSLLVPDAGARIDVAGRHRVTAAISHDPGAPTAVLKQVTGVLQAQGLRRRSG